MIRLPGAILCVAVAIGVSACASKVTPVPQDAHALEATSCRELYATLDAQVAQAGVGDAQSARIAGYAYLRIDRFLASDELKPEPGSDGFDAWV